MQTHNWLFKKEKKASSFFIQKRLSYQRVCGICETPSKTPFCPKHACSIPDCKECVSFFKPFCLFHQQNLCQHLNCIVPVVNQEMCDLHKCKELNCPKSKANFKDWCPEHLIFFNICQNSFCQITSPNHPFCENHRCEELNCCQEKEFQYKFCLNHIFKICSAKRCLKRTSGLDDYCYDHQCKLHGCKKYLKCKIHKNLCLVSGCSNDIYKGSFCLKHICMEVGCLNQKVIDLYCCLHITGKEILNCSHEACPLRGIKKLCRFHLENPSFCKVCNNKEAENGYCENHIQDILFLKLKNINNGHQFRNWLADHMPGTSNYDDDDFYKIEAIGKKLFPD